MNSFDRMTASVREAEHQMRVADMFAGRFAELLVGRLRHVDRVKVLRQLKKELRDFNMTTGEWNNS